MYKILSMLKEATADLNALTSSGWENDMSLVGINIADYAGNSAAFMFAWANGIKLRV